MADRSGDLIRFLLIAAAFGAAAIQAGCAGSSAAHPEASWGYAPASDREGPKLFFGFPETDNVSLGFGCPPAAAAIEIHLRYSDGEPAPQSVRLASDGVERSYSLSIPADADDTWVVGRAALDDPFFQAFARTGRLALIEGNWRSSIPARTSAERADVRAFHAACTKPATPPPPTALSKTAR